MGRSRHAANIRLKEAMTREDFKDYQRFWEVPGLNVPKELCENPTMVIKTFVHFDSKDGEYAVCVEETRNLMQVMYPVDKLGSLDEFEKKYPNLFEMSGLLVGIGY